MSIDDTLDSLVPLSIKYSKRAQVDLNEQEGTSNTNNHSADCTQGVLRSGSTRSWRGTARSASVRSAGAGSSLGLASGLGLDSRGVGGGTSGRSYATSDLKCQVRASLFASRVDIWEGKQHEQITPEPWKSNAPLTLWVTWALVSAPASLRHFTQLPIPVMIGAVQMHSLYICAAAALSVIPVALEAIALHCSFF